jgi:hypothetical protein
MARSIDVSINPTSTDLSTFTSTYASTATSMDGSTEVSTASSFASTSTDASRGASTLTDSFPHAVATRNHPPAASQAARGVCRIILVVFTRSETQG